MRWGILLILKMVILMSLMESNPPLTLSNLRIFISLMHSLCVICNQLVSVFIIRRRHSPSGSYLGMVEGEERQLLFAPHLGARLWQLVAVGEGGQEGRGFVRGCAGSDACSSVGRQAPGPPAAWRLHLSVGGIQLQLKQQHPVVWEGQGG